MRRGGPAIALAACSSDLFPIVGRPTTGDAGELDASHDGAPTDAAAADGAAGADGAAMDAAPDAPRDALLDAPRDALSDGAIDARSDGAIDAGADATGDAPDAAVPDAGSDATDAGPTYTVTLEQAGLFLGVGGPGASVSGFETETWTDTTTLEVVCVVSYELVPAAVGPGCPACDFGWEFTLVDAQPAGPDCARVGVFSAQSSRRGPLHYGYRETSGGAVRLGELLLAPGSAPWAIAGTVQIGGDPAVSADYLVTGTWPEPFSAP